MTLLAVADFGERPEVCRRTALEGTMAIFQDAVGLSSFCQTAIDFPSGETAGRMESSVVTCEAWPPLTGILHTVGIPPVLCW